MAIEDEVATTQGVTKGLQVILVTSMIVVVLNSRRKSTKKAPEKWEPTKSVRFATAAAIAT
jgi:hypothetical protein